MKIGVTQKDIDRIEAIVKKYTEGVKSGEIPACRLVRLAVKRQEKDLETGPSRGLEFRKDYATHAVKFFSFLKLWKGKEYKGKEFALSPHYVFITWVLMGWYRQDGTRRFRKAYIEQARKSAKSTYAGGLGSYFFVADGESGGECYCAAVKREQARIVWENIKNLTLKSGFAKKITYLTHNLSIEETNSKCEPLASDSKSLDGLDTHFASLDELHAHPTREVHDLIDDSIGARSQPLILIITTAGYNQTGICYETREYLIQILKGVVQDDSFFGIIYTLDTKKDWSELKDAQETGEGEREDDWTNEDVWVKAAPGLIGTTESGKRFGIDENGNPIPGYMTKLEDMRDKARIAKLIPAAQNNFLTKRLNIWTQQAEKWLDLGLWDRNFKYKIDEEALKGRLCFGGLDLSSVSDFTAWVLVFPDKEDPEQIDILARFWCPQGMLTERRNRYREQYQAWARDGWLISTSGDAIDYGFIHQRVLEDDKKFQLNSFNIDRKFQGAQVQMDLATELSHSDDRVFSFGQGWKSMDLAMRELEARLLKGKVNHGNNPIMRFCAENISIDRDKNENMSPNKKNSQGKIDGMVALIMALDRAIRNAKPINSKYEKEGLLTL